MMKIINLQVKVAGVGFWSKKAINLLFVISANFCRFIFQTI